MAVNQEPYGGGDLIQGFISAGVFTTRQYSASKVDWFLDLKIRPLNSGKMGAAGIKRNVKSSMGNSYRVGGISKAGIRELEWGGLLEINSLTLTLDSLADYSNELKLSDVVLMAIGRIRL